MDLKYKKQQNAADEKRMKKIFVEEEHYGEIKTMDFQNCSVILGYKKGKPKKKETEQKESLFQFNGNISSDGQYMNGKLTRIKKNWWTNFWDLFGGSIFSLLISIALGFIIYEFLRDFNLRLWISILLSVVVFVVFSFLFHKKMKEEKQSFLRLLDEILLYYHWKSFDTKKKKRG